MRSGLPHPRFLLFLAVFIGVAVLAMLQLGAELGLVLGFDAGAIVFIGASVPLWLDDHPDKIRARAARDDGGRVLLLLLAGIAIGVVLLALLRLIEGRVSHGPLGFVLIVGTLMLAWVFINLIFTFHYAHVYYDQADGVDVGGLAFPGKQPPIFADFCYFSFVVGMTSQVSDVQILTRNLRRVATLHGLFAFFFNLGVLALTVNVVSGLL